MGPAERDLLRAAGKGDLEEVKRLVQAGVNVSAINEEGVSALSTSITKKRVPVAKYLLESGATTNYSGFLVEKPLHKAVIAGDVKLVELVLDHDADIDTLAGGQSALSRAVASVKEDIVSLLLARGADVDLTSHVVHAPLMIAITKQKEQFVEKLLEYGADTELLSEQLAQVSLPRLTQVSQALLKSWAANGYGEYVRDIRGSSLTEQEKKTRLTTALRSAAHYGQPDIHALFSRLGRELNLEP